MTGHIHPDDLRRIEQETDLAAVIAEHTPLAAGPNEQLRGQCPFHDDQAANLAVRARIGRWHCFGCGEGGDVITFVMRAEGTSFAASAERLAEAADIRLRYVD
ncbi:CHC2-type zinc finger protein [Kineococcus xinjiangensis]|uniref:CHC2-type zinc finger protein n=1 Tax=Kineococcus xinjiangensis TaxID=512762 RepID=A0A2S6ID32_9ACTN|nr:CHC2 zinc finger domain-containing protein [Kineococcus xinjiangensis]PPK92132.1 CHC2-type zinc finger protein [Kineococcus xinjiangensis]